MSEPEHNRYGDKPPEASSKGVRPTKFAHDIIHDHVKEGDRVIDATVGNGHDTIFLAELVGPSGHVDGFDIQSEAIESAQLMLQGSSFEQVTLHQVGHEKMAGMVKSQVQAVMFNLGYLPGGDKQLTTQPETTIVALQTATELLAPGGLITIVVYTGHPGGQEEADAVHAFCCELDTEQFATTIHKSSLDNPTAPFLISIVRF